MKPQNNEFESMFSKAAKAYTAWEQYKPFINKRLPDAIRAVEKGRRAYDPTYQSRYVNGMSLDIIGASPHGLCVTAIDIKGVTDEMLHPLGFIPKEALQDPEKYSTISLEYEKCQRNIPNRFYELWADLCKHN